jgi:addiction module HigA family antidote
VGEVVWFGVLEPLGLSVTRAAVLLDVRRATLSDLINGKSAISAEMAFRLHKVFGPDPDHLMRMQAAYDLAQVRKRQRSLKLKRYVAKAA